MKTGNMIEIQILSNCKKGHLRNQIILNKL